MLSLSKYLWKCVLGIELVYSACLFYEFGLTAEKVKLHHDLLELLPFFEWGNPLRMAMTGLCLAVYAIFFGWYMVWMHNSSLEKSA